MAEKTSRLAIASLVVGILSLFVGWVPLYGWIVIITGLVLSIVALIKISKYKELRGKWLAIVGIILCVMSIFFAFIFVVRLIYIA